MLIVQIELVAAMPPDAGQCSTEQCVGNTHHPHDGEKPAQHPARQFQGQHHRHGAPYGVPYRRVQPDAVVHLIVVQAEVDHEPDTGQAQDDIEGLHGFSSGPGGREQQEPDDAEQPHAEAEKQPRVQLKYGQREDVVQRDQYRQRGHHIFPGTGQGACSGNAFLKHLAGLCLANITHQGSP